MKYNIKSLGDDIKIIIDDINYIKDGLLKSIINCQKGECDCSTNELTKLDELIMTPIGNDIILHLVPRKGEKFNIKEIEKCFNYKIAKLSKEHFKFTVSNSLMQNRISFCF